MKFSLAILSTLVIALCGLFFLTHRINDARFAAMEARLAATAVEEDYEVGITMAWLQRWTDKLGRSAEAGHWELASFYLHEIEETAEDLINAGVEDEGHNISELVRGMLWPAIEPLEAAVEARDAALFATRYTALIQNCNSCHGATGFAHVRITPPAPPNPWNQDFTPLPKE